VEQKSKLLAAKDLWTGIVTETVKSGTRKAVK
jgi:hypothetical protein